MNVFRSCAGASVSPNPLTSKVTHAILATKVAKKAFYGNRRSMLSEAKRLILAVALDGHGVIYHRRREVVDALVEALYNQSLIFSKKEARFTYLALQEKAFAGQLSYEEMLRELHRELRLGSRLSLEQLHELIQRFSAEIEVDPELPSTLRELRSRGVRIGMLTNSIHPAHIKEEWLRKVGVDKLFDLVLSSVDERCKKPAPEFFHRFALRLGLSPEAVAFVGHDPQEIEGASNAGLLPIALNCPESRAGFHIRRLGELLMLPIWPGKKEVS